MDPFCITKLDHPTEADAVVLSQISKASKAYWGYPSAWLKLWEEGLTFTVNYLLEHQVFTMQILPKEETIGCCVIMEESPSLWIEHLWVLPDYIGKGFGSLLMKNALEACITDQHQSIKVVADPNAVPFYNAKGFQIIGYHPSVPNNRQLPIMEKLLHLDSK